MHPLLQRFVAGAGVLCALAALMPPRADASSPPSTVTYAVRHQPPQRLVAAFEPLIADAPDVSLSVPANRALVVLSGPDWAHELFVTVLERMDHPRKAPPAADTPGAAGPTPQQAAESTAGGRAADAADQSPARLLPPRSRRAEHKPSGTAGAEEVQRRLLPLPRGSSVRLRRDCLALIGDRIRQPQSGDGPWVLETDSGPLQIAFDLGRHDVLLDGPASVIEQFARLLAGLSNRYRPQPTDSAAGGPQTTRVLLLPRELQADVRQLFGGWTDDDAARPDGISRTRVDNPGLENVLLRLTGARQATGGEPNAPPPTEQSRSGGGEGSQSPPPAQGEQSLPQLEGVEVELLPDLDAIILKGRDRDLSQLAEIIRELERLSRETQPAIELVPLRHVAAARIAELVTESQAELLGTRQGTAQLVPLAKPNAVLLIGWGEAVESLRSLVDKLDQAVPPQSQFELFRLRHAVAATVQQTVEEFLTDRDGQLSPLLQTTVDPRTNSFIVHASPRDMAEIRALVGRLDTPSGGLVQRTRVFPIQNSLAADIAETLQETIQSGDGQATAMELMLGPDGQTRRIVSGILENIQITPDVRKNALIVSAPAENFDVIEALIRQLDSPGTTAKIKIFEIENSDAASLVETLRSLLPSQTDAAASSPQLSSAPGESSLAPLRFTVDVRSNSIIATGSEGDLAIVDALITRLDEADQMQRRNTVYQLKNSPAVDVALAINEFLRNSRQVESATPGAVNPYEQLEKEVVVVPEPVSNKLIVSATPRYYEEIRQMIESLDAQPPQVMIQVLIAEVDLDNTDEFGVELGIQDSVLFDRSLLGELLTITNTEQTSTPSGILTSTTQEIIAASNIPGFNFNSTQDLGNSGSGRALSGAGNVGGQGLSNFAVGRGNDELGFGGLVLSASSQNVSVLLRALEESRRLEVLSRPQVLTLDNQPAFIQVGQRVPRITGSTISQVGQQNNVELENVGLILGVTPRISPEGNVTMEIDAEKSSIGPESEGIPVSVSNDGTIIRSPRVDVTSAQATVSAADGETIILGGLITKSRREVHRQVPYLGDLPVLRHLFRFDSMQVSRTELLIILTPHVIRTPADAERLKQIEMARMSWCAADVFDLHGEIYGSSDASMMLHQVDGDVPVIYPHSDPRGQSGEPSAMPADDEQPGTKQPTPAPNPPFAPVAPFQNSEPIPAPDPTVLQAPDPVYPNTPSAPQVPNTTAGGGARR
jgi:type II secretion system protein D